MVAPEKPIAGEQTALNGNAGEKLLAEKVSSWAGIAKKSHQKQAGDGTALLQSASGAAAGSEVHAKEPASQRIDSGVAFDSVAMPSVATEKSIHMNGLPLAKTFTAASVPGADSPASAPVSEIRFGGTRSGYNAKQIVIPESSGQSSGKKRWKPLDVEISFNAPLPPKGSPRRDLASGGYGDRRFKRPDEDRHTPRRPFLPASEKASEGLGSDRSEIRPDTSAQPSATSAEQPVETAGVGDRRMSTASSTQTPPRGLGDAERKFSSPDGYERRGGPPRGHYSPGYRGDFNRMGRGGFGPRGYTPNRRPAQSPVPADSKAPSQPNGKPETAEDASGIALEVENGQRHARRTQSAPMNALLTDAAPTANNQGSTPASPSYRRSGRYPPSSWSRQTFANPVFYYGGNYAVAPADQHLYPGAYLSLYTGPSGQNFGVPASPNGMAATHFAIADPSHYQAMHLTVPLVQSYVRAQVEWYFSTDNLCRDLFLRRQMDSSGWVDGAVIGGFRRVSGWIDHLRVLLAPESETIAEGWGLQQMGQALTDSTVVEADFSDSEGGQLLRLRKRDGWATWIFPATNGAVLDLLPPGETVAAQTSEGIAGALQETPQITVVSVEEGGASTSSLPLQTEAIHGPEDEERNSNQTGETIADDAAQDESGEATLVGDAGSTSTGPPWDEFVPNLGGSDSSREFEAAHGHMLSVHEPLVATNDFVTRHFSSAKVPQKPNWAEHVDESGGQASSAEAPEAKDTWVTVIARKPKSPKKFVEEAARTTGHLGSKEFNTMN